MIGILFFIVFLVLSLYAAFWILSGTCGLLYATGKFLERHLGSYAELVVALVIVSIIVWGMVR